MIYVGLDDTDTLDSRGTNQLARRIGAELPSGLAVQWIVRHQLFFDPRVPYTSKNGSASLTLIPSPATGQSGKTPCQQTLQELAKQIAKVMRDDFIPGSDPGLAVAGAAAAARATAFAHRCKTTLVTQREARELARELGIPLLGLGGTEDGVIGALAAVGLACTASEGRIVQLGPDPMTTDSCSGEMPIATLTRLGLMVQTLDRIPVEQGVVEVGKKLRPNLHQGRPVLFVEPTGPTRWRALKLV